MNKVKRDQVIVGTLSGAAGGFVGSLVGGPLGGVFGAAASAFLGNLVAVRLKKRREA